MAEQDLLFFAVIPVIVMIVPLALSMMGKKKAAGALTVRTKAINAFAREMSEALEDGKITPEEQKRLTRAAARICD